MITVFLSLILIILTTVMRFGPMYYPFLGTVATLLVIQLQNLAGNYFLFFQLRNNKQTTNYSATTLESFLAVATFTNAILHN